MTMLGCLVLGFQNCARSGASSSADDASSTGPAVLNSSISQIGQVSAVEISYGQGGELVVDLSTGHINELNAQGVSAGAYCASATDLQDLQTLLASAQLCEGTTTTSSANQVCAQSYTAPYATLVSSSVIKLGESFDSCGTGLQDLCGETAVSFKNLLSDISGNLQSCQ